MSVPAESTLAESKPAPGGGGAPVREAPGRRAPASRGLPLRGAPPLPRILPTDGELLTLLTRHDDRDALDRLVDRHAAMVWRVCRQSLRRQQDAEDAFQATFLLLIKHARSIRSSESAAGWLYRVAYRTSLRARKKLAARREESLALDPHAPGEEAFPDLLARQTTGVLVEELMRLPAKYQTPLVLRYLEGQSRRAIADQTDTTVASVQGRLARGKQLLRRRLMRRGVSLSAAMAALGLAGRGAQATETAPAHVLAQTTSNSVAVATGGSLAASAAVVSLYQQGVRAMLLIGLAKPAGVAAAVAAVVLLTMAPGASGDQSQPKATSGALALDATVTATIEEEPTARLAQLQPANEREPEASAPGVEAPEGREAKTLAEFLAAEPQGLPASRRGESSEDRPQRTPPTDVGGSPENPNTFAPAGVTGRVVPSGEAPNARFTPGELSPNVRFGDALGPDGQPLPDAEQGELLLEMWAQKVAANPPPADGEPTVKELHTWHTFWELKYDALRQRSRLLLEPFNGKSYDQMTVEQRSQLAEAQELAAEVYRARAEMLRYERELKTRALKASKNSKKVLRAPTVTADLGETGTATLTVSGRQVTATATPQPDGSAKLNLEVAPEKETASRRRESSEEPPQRTPPTPVGGSPTPRRSTATSPESTLEPYSHVYYVADIVLARSGSRQNDSDLMSLLKGLADEVQERASVEADPLSQPKHSLLIKRASRDQHEAIQSYFQLLRNRMLDGRLNPWAPGSENDMRSRAGLGAAEDAAQASRRRESSEEPTARTPPTAVGGSPTIVATVPERGATNVDPGLEEVRITFDRDMSTGGYSFTGNAKSGMPEVPKGKKPRWLDKRTCVLPVKLGPGREYRVGINAPSYKNFKSAEGVPAVVDELRFTTAETKADFPPGNSRVMKNPAYANPGGWTTVAELEVGQTAPLYAGTEGNSDPPRIRLTKNERDGAILEIVDPGHATDGSAKPIARRDPEAPWETRVGWVSVKLLSDETSRESQTALLILRSVSGPYGSTLSEVTAEGVRKALYQSRTDAREAIDPPPKVGPASRRRESSEDSPVDPPPTPVGGSPDFEG